MRASFEEQMGRELGQLGIELDAHQLEQFFTYYEMLVEKNKVMNLTAITEESEVVTKHFSDSLSLVKAFAAEGADEGKAGETFLRQPGLRLIDVGTGAGFPGIPLGILYPEMKITLLDSLNKRVLFLQEVCGALGLTNVEAVHSRAEDGGRNPLYREQYDLCVSRAVANLASLAEYCLPFVKVGGYFVSYKSGDVKEELAQAGRAVELLGGETEDVVSFALPDSDMARSLVKIKKIKMTAKKYPRKAGMPGKEPLH